MALFDALRVDLHHVQRAQRQLEAADAVDPSGPVGSFEDVAYFTLHGTMEFNPIESLGVLE